MKRNALILPAGPVLVISPHLDDAVLSAGGFLWELRQRGHELIVLTVMAGIEGMRETDGGAKANRSGGLDSANTDPFRARRIEDIRALEVLDLGYRHVDRETALNRVRSDGTAFYPSGHHIQQGPAPDDPTRALVVEQLRAIDREFVHSSVLGPIGHGGHPDHEIVHAAVMEVFRDQCLYLWYDRPYSSNYRLRNPLARRVPMTDNAKVKKLEASNHYESQTVQLFVTGSPSHEILGGGFETFVKGNGFEVELERIVRRVELLSGSARYRLSPRHVLRRLRK